MSNDYGIGAGLLAAGRMLEQLARGTGRTTNMLRAVKDGDIIVVPNASVRDHIDREQFQAGLKGRVVICRPTPMDVAQASHSWPRRPVHFDHTWVEAFFERVVEDARKELFRMQSEMSRDPDTAPRGIVERWGK